MIFNVPSGCMPVQKVAATFIYPEAKICGMVA